MSTRGVLVVANGVSARFKVAGRLRRPTLLSGISLVDWWPLRIVLLAVTVLVFAAMIWPARRRASRVAVLGLGLALVAVNCLAAVNSYYGFYLTTGQAIGLPDGEQDSLEDLANRHTQPGSGVVLSLDIPGTKSGFAARPAQAYVPPAWFRSPRPKLPVVVLLHGTPGSPGDWLHGGAAQTTADAWAAGHGGVAPIVVMPDVNGDELEDTECVDRPSDNAETYLTTDVPEFIRKQFFVASDKRNWAIAGLSEGGSCAIMLALRHPAVYPTFADFGGLAGPRSGDTNAPGDTAQTYFGGSQRQFNEHEPAFLLARSRFPGMHGFFAVGSSDPEPFAATQQLSALSRRAGIDTQVVIFPGGTHTFDVWRAAFQTSLPWLAEHVGLTPGIAHQAGR